LINRVPVHDLGFLVGDALFEHAQEHPLVPLVVIRAAGGELAIPVDGKAERFQLHAHVIDVVPSPLGRRHLVLDRGVFSRQAKSIPAHRLHDIKALHLVKTGQYIANRVVAHMAHVQLARRVGEHRQAVILGLAAVFNGFENLVLFPFGLGGGFDRGRGVLFLHGVACGVCFSQTADYSVRRGACSRCGAFCGHQSRCRLSDLRA